MIYKAPKSLPQAILLLLLLVLIWMTIWGHTGSILMF